MLYSNLRYGAMDNRDYLLFEFYRKNGNEKNKFLTKRRYYQLIKRFDKETFINLINKEFMYRDYDKFIDRKWILVGSKSNEKEIYSFLSQFETVIIKQISLVVTTFSNLLIRLVNGIRFDLFLNKIYD